MTQVRRKRSRIKRLLRKSKTNAKQILAMIKAGKTGQPRRCLPQGAGEKLKRTAQYHRSKPNPRNWARRNHDVLRRLTNFKFVNPVGLLRSTVRQLLANENIVETPRLEHRYFDIVDRLEELVNSYDPEEYKQFQIDFRQWHREGSPENKQNTFWRITYCGLIELLWDFRHWDQIYRLHQARQRRGLKSALDYKN